MPITIVCPGCHGRFSVSEKFAGKQGPCPKCKTVISIPKASEEVKIHAPEDYGGAKTATGKLVLKPIAREATKLSTTWVLAIGAATLITIGLAFMLGRAFPPDATPSDAGGPAVVEKPDPTRNPLAAPDCHGRRTDLRFDDAPRRKRVRRKFCSRWALWRHSSRGGHLWKKAPDATRNSLRKLTEVPRLYFGLNTDFRKRTTSRAGLVPRTGSRRSPAILGWHILGKTSNMGRHQLGA